jgi:hypothetical protein
MVTAHPSMAQNISFIARTGFDTSSNQTYNLVQVFVTKERAEPITVGFISFSDGRTGEIFAGAGENIRYQVAGGETAPANRVPANVKPTKILNWEFDGEYWEDEIGNYRSQAQDNCPQKGKIGAGGSSGAQTFNTESK